MFPFTPCSRVCVIVAIARVFGPGPVEYGNWCVRAATTSSRVACHLDDRAALANGSEARPLFTRNRPRDGELKRMSRALIQLDAPAAGLIPSPTRRQ